MTRDVHRTEHLGAPPAYSSDETQTAFLTDAFLNWREIQDRPWFAHISFLRPHPPFCVPEPYASMFAPGDGPAYARAADRQTEADMHPFLRFAMAVQQKSSFVQGEEGPVSDWTAADLDRIRATYYGMIAEVDAQFGRIVAALRDSGQWDNTIIVFTSDHAEMMGDHWSLGKGGYHDGSYHIPLVIRDPVASGAAGRQVDAFTGAADIMPTLCERLGLVPRNHQDGRSLLPFVAGGEPERWRDAAFFEFDFRDVGERHAGGAVRSALGPVQPVCAARRGVQICAFFRDAAAVVRPEGGSDGASQRRGRSGLPRGSPALCGEAAGASGGPSRPDPGLY